MKAIIKAGLMAVELDGTPQELVEVWLGIQVPEMKSEPICSNPIGGRTKEETKKVPTREKASKKPRSRRR